MLAKHRRPLPDPRRADPGPWRSLNAAALSPGTPAPPSRTIPACWCRRRACPCRELRPSRRARPATPRPATPVACPAVPQDALERRPRSSVGWRPASSSAARQVLSSDNQEARYAFELLVDCCKLDPANLDLPRRCLRQAGRELPAPAGAGAMAGHRCASWSPRTRLKAAKHTGDFRKVLQQGEVVLARTPEDIATHLDMAMAAEGLNLPYLETWLLEQACQAGPEESRTPAPPGRSPRHRRTWTGPSPPGKASASCCPTTPRRRGRSTPWRSGRRLCGGITMGDRPASTSAWAWNARAGSGHERRFGLAAQSASVGE